MAGQGGLWKVCARKTVCLYAWPFAVDHWSSGSTLRSWNCEIEPWGYTVTASHMVWLLFRRRIRASATRLRLTSDRFRETVRDTCSNVDACRRISVVRMMMMSCESMGRKLTRFLLFDAIESDMLRYEINPSFCFWVSYHRVVWKIVWIFSLTWYLLHFLCKHLQSCTRISGKNSGNRYERNFVKCDLFTQKCKCQFQLFNKQSMY